MLCTRCRRAMCKDCRQIADEYEELLRNWKAANSWLSGDVERLQRDLERERKKAVFWEEMSKLGLPEVLQRWMDAEATRCTQSS